MTNRELEPFRRRRELEEEEYERTRKKRGLPSKEELRRRTEEQDRRLREMSERLEAERLEAEVESLRAELGDLARRLEDFGSQESRPSQTYEAQPVYQSGFYPHIYAPGVPLFEIPRRARRPPFYRNHRPHHSRASSREPGVLFNPRRSINPLQGRGGARVPQTPARGGATPTFSRPVRPPR